MLLGRVNFVKRIRKVRIRTNKLWISRVDVAMVKLLDGIGRYEDLREIEVIIQDRHSCQSLGANNKVSEALVHWHKSRRRDIKITVRTEKDTPPQEKETEALPTHR